MKLEENLHSSTQNSLRKPEPRLFYSCDNDMDTFVSETENVGLEEKRNGAMIDDSESSVMDATKLLSDCVNDDEAWDAQDFSCSMSVDGSTNGNESDDSANVDGSNIRVFDTTTRSSKKLQFPRETNFYMDKSVMESEPAKSIVCFKENTYHVIKDICVDEGVPSQEKTFAGSSRNEHFRPCTFVASNGDRDLKKDSADLDLPTRDWSQTSVEAPCDKVVPYFDTEDMLQEGGGKNDAIGEIVSDGLEGRFFSERGCVVCDTGKEESSCKSTKNDEVDAEPEHSAQNSSRDKIWPSLISASEVEGESEGSSPGNELAYSSKVDDGVSTFNAAASCSGKAPGDYCHESRHGPQFETGSLGSQHGDGEMCPMSGLGLVTYLDPIEYSGSISLRSDTSTTSNCSFAFPVLQPEWNSSPVRMAKADRRLFRKHRGWRHGLLCCKF